jgi:hypothetical protein
MRELKVIEDTTENTVKPASKFQASTIANLLSYDEVHALGTFEKLHPTVAARFNT